MEWIRPGHNRGPNPNNVSATVSIKPDEWGLVGEWMWANKDYYSGISVLPYDGGTYVQAPFESITKEQYEEMSQNLHGIDLTKIIELQDVTDLSGEVACANGYCEI
jgi:ribonucleoside-diphosphate reductase alpha chain